MEVIPCCRGSAYICLPLVYGVRIAPWLDLVRSIPFSPQVFVAGSAATWLAEMVLLETLPVWSPGDIDIFVLHDADRFQAIVDEYITRHCSVVGSSIVYRQNIVDIKVNSHISEPVISFVRCLDAESPSQLVAGFDVDICKVCLAFIKGRLSLSLQSDVAASIVHRRMRVVVNKSAFKPLHYPLSRTIMRVQKYRARGYLFQSLTFSSFDPAVTELDVEEFNLMKAWSVLGDQVEGSDDFVKIWQE